MLKKYKIFFIAVLSLLVVGMILFGIFGINSDIDSRKAYELKVSVNIDVEDSVEVTKTASEKAIKDNGLNYVDVQVADDGMTIIYKFDKDATKIKTKVQTAVQTALDKLGNSQLEATVESNVVIGGYYKQVGKFILALGIALAIVFIYSLILEKLSGGVAVGCSTLLAGVLATAMLGITRIPAGANVGALIAIAMAVGGGLSAMLCAKYRTGLKTADKVRPNEIVENVHLSMIKVYAVLAIVLCVIALLGLILGVRVFVLMLGVALSAIVGIASSAYTTPFMWSLIKSRKKK